MHSPGDLALLRPLQVLLPKLLCFDLVLTSIFLTVYASGFLGPVCGGGGGITSLKRFSRV